MTSLIRQPFMAIFCSLMLLGATFAEEPQWPQFGGPNRDFSLPASTAKWKTPTELWRQPLGFGTSAIVGDSRRLFTMFSVPLEENKNEGEEVVVALDAVNGKTIWRQSEQLKRLKGQQSFSGDAIRPQATPALNGGRLFTLGYTGILTCFEASEGKVLWRKDLVKDFAAKPVQFGFSSSPLVVDDRLIVHVGGAEAALIAFDCATGNVLWKSEPAEPSYATPVLLKAGDITQILQVTRDSLLCVSIESGKTLWNFPLPDVGLTNVPTPVLLDGQSILVGGQGYLGARRLELKESDEKWEVVESWHNAKIKPFYCNTLLSGRFAVSAFDDFLGAVEIRTGKELWRVRGHKDSNLIKLSDGILCLRGDGQLSLCDVDEKGITARWSIPTLTGRTWTPPTLIGDTIFVRNEAEVMALSVVEP